MYEYKLVVCDDQQCFIDDMKGYLKAYESESNNKIIVLEYLSGKDLLEDIKEQGLKQDIWFLDVDMPEKKGIDVAKEIKEVYPDAVICFITSYEDYAYEAYRTEALGYLVKPVKYQELRRMLNRCATQVQYQRNAVETKKRFIEVKINRGTVLLDTDEILYIEKRKNQCVFHLEDGEILSYITLKQASQLLDNTVFYTVHQGYIVNFRHIKEVRTDSVCLGKNREVPVSRRNHEKLRNLHMRKIQHLSDNWERKRLP